MRKAFAVVLIISFLVVFLSGCNFSDKTIGFVFGTTYELDLGGKNVRKAKKDILELLNDIDNTLSTSIEGSDVYNINHSAVNTPVTVKRLTMDMFVKSKELYIKTEGAFNPALFPIVSLWGFSPDGNSEGERVPPEQSQIDSLLPFCSFDYFTADEENLTITRLSAYSELDFGAIAKGYAVQKALETVKSYKLDRAVINVGGTVSLYGDSVKAGIRNPRESDNICFASFNMINGYTVATSGDYERYFMYEDIRYHHIMDTATGRPVDNGIIAVTVLTEDGTMSDALSTAVFCLGIERGLALAEEKGAKCLIITEDYTYYVSDNFDIEVLEEDYKAAQLEQN